MIWDLLLNAVLCFRLKLHLPCGSANPLPVNSTRAAPILCTRKQQYSMVLSLLFHGEAQCHSTLCTSPACYWLALGTQPSSIKEGILNWFVNFCTLQSQCERNLLMVKWQSLVLRIHVTFKNCITILGWIFISEVPNCERNFLVKEDYMRNMRLVCFVGSIAI